MNGSGRAKVMLSAAKIAAEYSLTTQVALHREAEIPSASSGQALRYAQDDGTLGFVPAQLLF